MIKIQTELEISNPSVKMRFDIETKELFIWVEYDCMHCVGESDCRFCDNGLVDDININSMQALRKYFGDEIAAGIRDKIIEAFSKE